MKTNFKLLLLLLTIFLSNACSKSENDETIVENTNNLNFGKGYIQIDNGPKLEITAPILQGFFTKDNTDTNDFAMTLEASTSSTTFKSVQFSFNYPYNTNISGTYTAADLIKNFEIDMSTYRDIIKSDISTNITSEDVIDGTFTINHISDKNYTVSFSIKTELNKQITGEFSGNMLVQTMQK
ncbi:MAG TPA: hypothetical protein VJU52_11450 [Flavobacterium sp.]|nr:hypothetical protein [Flavobacterium sp.]